MQQRLIGEIFALVCHRPPSACNFLPLPPLLAPAPSSAAHSSEPAPGADGGAGGAAAGAWRRPTGNDDDEDPAAAPDRPALLTYRHYATLYFILISTATESPLALLDLIQVFVEALDRLFADVCELDLIFNFETLHAVLGEMIVGGVVVETGLDRIVRGVRAQGAVPSRKDAMSRGGGGGGGVGVGSGLAALGWGGAGMRGVG